MTITLRNITGTLVGPDNQPAPDGTIIYWRLNRATYQGDQTIAPDIIHTHVGADGSVAQALFVNAAGGIDTKYAVSVPWLEMEVTVVVTAGSSDLDIIALLFNISLPATPALPTLTPSSNGTGTVSVNVALVTGAASYNIQRKTGIGGVYLPIATGVVTLPYGDGTTTFGTTYYYKISATNIAGDSGFSPEANTTTESIATPAVPVLSSALTGTNEHLTTTATARVTTYKIFRNLNSAGYAGSPYATASVPIGTALDYHDTAINSGDNVKYKVKASNITGDSAFSNEVNDTAAITPVDPLSITSGALIWIDAQPAGHAAGDSIATISDQTAAANNVTVNGNNAIYRTSPIKYFENTVTSGRFTINTPLTTVRHIIMVYRYRGMATVDNTNQSQGLFSYAGGGTNINTAGGPGVLRLIIELFEREYYPSGAGISAVLTNPATTIRINGGTQIAPIPQMDASWSGPGTGWVHPSSLQVAAPKDTGFVILSIKLASVLSLDTLMNIFGIPGTAFVGDLAAFGCWSSPLSSTNEAGVVQFLKTRYSLNLSPQENIYFGDSLTQGIDTGNPSYQNLTTKVEQDNLANGLVSGGINLGIGSAPLNEISTAGSLAWVFSNYWGTAFRDTSRTKQVIVMWTGQNDIVQSGGRTGAQIYANDQAICAVMRSMGFKIVRISIAPSQTNGLAPYDATAANVVRQDWLTLMTTDHSHVDAYVDYSANTQIGSPTSYVSFPANFFDWIHLTPAGYDILVPLVGTAIRSV
jgi:hypothetical protein